MRAHASGTIHLRIVFNLYMNSLRKISLLFIGLVLVGCASTKPQWPAPPSSVVKSMKSERPTAYSVLVQSSHNELGPVVDEKEAVNSIQRVLSSMALESYVEDIMVNQLQRSGIENISRISKTVSADRKRIIAKEKAMRVGIKQGLVSNADFLSLLTEKAKLNVSKLMPYEARLYTTYDISSDGLLVGLSSRLIYALPTSEGSTFRCEDEFYISEVSGLDASLELDNQYRVASSVARNFHLVKASFERAALRLSKLVSSHVSDRSAIFDDVANLSHTNLTKIDFVAVDGTYLEGANSIVSEDGLITAYLDNSTNNRFCERKIYTIQTTEQAQDFSLRTRQERKQKQSLE